MQADRLNAILARRLVGMQVDRAGRNHARRQNELSAKICITRGVRTTGQPQRPDFAPGHAGLRPGEYGDGVATGLKPLSRSFQ